MEEKRINLQAIELAKALEVDASLIDKAVADGAPKQENGIINLVELAAWLCRERLKSED